MKTKSAHRVIRCAALLLLSALNAQFSTVFAQGTAFTYQGQLNDGATPASGIYDLQFTIYDSTNSPGVVIAGPLTNAATGVSNGLFTVTLDFGNVFPGLDRWLEIAVRTNNPSAAFTPLAPRQKLTPTPYAITAGNLSGVVSSASLSGTYSGAVTFNNAANGFSGAFTGNGAGVTNLNASQLASGTVPDARLSGNVALLNGDATFLGTVQALGDLQGRRLNVGTDNLLTGDWSSILGGAQNTNHGHYSTIVGGQWNVLHADWSHLGAGIQNFIETNSYGGVIGGGEVNSIAGDSRHATIGGGVANAIGMNSERTVISGGDQNRIGNNSIYASVAGGHENHIGTDADSAAIGGGKLNKIGSFSPFALIAGGAANDIGTNALGNVVSGGEDNNIANETFYAVIAGGVVQNIGTNSDSSVIGGGEGNTVLANGFYAIIPGGVNNTATAYGFAAGANARAVNRGAFVWSDSNAILTQSAVNNSVTMRASGGYRFFTGTGTNGAQLLAGATSWSILSDRNLKKDSRPVNCQLILDQLARIPITQWHYTWESESDPLNLGPMAQDFKAAFYPGRDDRTISTLELDGVALAAIQGLNQKVEAGSQRSEDRSRMLEERLQQKETEITELKQRLEALEKIVLKSE